MQRSLFGSYSSTPVIAQPTVSEVIDYLRGYVPRDYQQLAVDAAFAHYDAGKAGTLVRIPTGTGKTCVGAWIANRWIQRNPERNRVIVLCTETVLVEQFADDIYKILGEMPLIEMGNKKTYGDVPVVIACRASLGLREVAGETASRLFKFDPNKNWLVVCDESHKFTRHMTACKHIFDHFEQNPNSRRLGLTATPERLDKISPYVLFPSVASDYKLYDINGGPSAVNDGWAVRYDQRFVVVESVKFKDVGSRDWRDGEIAKELDDAKVIGKYVIPTIEHVGDRKTLIFSPTTEMAVHVALFINSHLGYNAAEFVHGGIRDRNVRMDIYRRHQAGEFQFLSACSLCKEGYNDPTIKAVAVFRPTKSKSLAEQMKGRGCRPLSGVVSSDMTIEERLSAIAASDKASCMIVDLVGVSGMRDCASTAQIMAEGKPDVVIERANKKLLDAQNDGEPLDVETAINEAEQEIATEEEKAKRAAEEAEAAKLAREEEMELARATAQRRAELGMEVTYTTQQVEQGEGGVIIQKDGKRVKMITIGQQNYLRRFGIKFDAEVVSIKVAKRVISQIVNGEKRGYSLEWIQKDVHSTNRLRKKKEVPKDEPKKPKEKSIYDDVFSLFRNGE